MSFEINHDHDDSGDDRYATLDIHRLEAMIRNAPDDVKAVSRHAEYLER